MSSGNDEAPIKGKVLVVDDDQASRQLVSMILKDAGYQVVEASSATRAMHLLGKQHGALLGAIIDLNMPNITGAELIAQMQAKRQLARLPIIVATASTNSADVRHVASMGIKGYAVKPVNRKSFIKLIDEVFLAKPPAAGVEAKPEPARSEPPARPLAGLDPTG